jgi:hypothetical protein
MQIVQILKRLRKTDFQDGPPTQQNLREVTFTYSLF